MIRYSAEQRPIIAQAAAFKREASKEAKRERPKKVAPPRTDKPDSALRERRPRVRDNGHLQFIRRHGCVVCADRGFTQATPTEAAHVRCGYPEPGWSYTGKAEKPDDWRTLPCCSDHHREQHARGDERAHWAEAGLYPPAMVAVFVQARAEGRDGPDVVCAAVAAGRLPSLSQAAPGGGE